MKRVIWKFPLEIGTDQFVAMPEGAQILTVQLQNKTPMMWALCNPDAPKRMRGFKVVGTGHLFSPKNLTYHGTFQVQNGMQTEWYVYHVFESV